eukprot:CAMPEP_0182439940 /NCGR_PEP_ID=MMETSP1167-20130531/86742_1 /TAXON_ID=2988 /ORGANISM="Mallomonas Sp, Strain CCMP3275" /LENGTH=340 /DNA_ID=CAMNT_0024633747 /DNA_START=609 /DNA_END=1631 /DNA_ORIENTATION=-
MCTRGTSTASEIGSKVCLYCGAGYYSLNGRIPCTACPDGFSSEAGARNCPIKLKSGPPTTLPTIRPTPIPVPIADPTTFPSGTPTTSPPLSFVYSLPRQPMIIGTVIITLLVIGIFVICLQCRKRQKETVELGYQTAHGADINFDNIDNRNEETEVEMNVFDPVFPDDEEVEIKSLSKGKGTVVKDKLQGVVQEAVKGFQKTKKDIKKMNPKPDKTVDKSKKTSFSFISSKQGKDDDYKKEENTMSFHKVRQAVMESDDEEEERKEKIKTNRIKPLSENKKRNHDIDDDVQSQSSVDLRHALQSIELGDGELAECHSFMPFGNPTTAFNNIDDDDDFAVF